MTAIPVFLGADVGGTKVFFRFTLNSRKEIYSLELPTASSASLESLIKQVLESFYCSFPRDQYVLTSACFGIAGPVALDGTVQMTNIAHWPTIYGASLAEACGVTPENVAVINDFEAIGYGIEVLTRSDSETAKNSFIPIYLPESLRGTSKIVAANSRNNLSAYVGAGTGIGAGFFTDNPITGEILVFASEGGHMTFSPTEPIDVRYAEFIKKYCGIDHVSCERAASGSGLYLLHRFLWEQEGNYRNSENDEFNIRLKQLLSENNDDIEAVPVKKTLPVILSEMALKNVPHCYQVMAMFFRLYAMTASNLAVVLIPNAIYIAGGILLKNIDLLHKDDDKMLKMFIESFTHKGRLSCVCEKTPLIVVNNDKVGLIGCCQKALVLHSLSKALGKN